MKINEETGLKRCPMCKTEKTKEFFNKCAGMIDGLTHHCRDCTKNKSNCLINLVLLLLVTSATKCSYYKFLNSRRINAYHLDGKIDHLGR